jgi:hypothetical protein
VDWQLRLITRYETIRKAYREHLWVYCQRFSPYVDLRLSDEGVLRQVRLLDSMPSPRETKQPRLRGGRVGEQGLLLPRASATTG